METGSNDQVTHVGEDMRHAPNDRSECEHPSGRDGRACEGQQDEHRAAYADANVAGYDQRRDGAREGDKDAPSRTIRRGEKTIRREQQHAASIGH